MSSPDAERKWEESQSFCLTFRRGTVFIIAAPSHFRKNGKLFGALLLVRASFRGRSDTEARRKCLTRQVFPSCISISISGHVVDLNPGIEVNEELVKRTLLFVFAVLSVTIIPVQARAQYCGGESGGTVSSCSSGNCFGQYESAPPTGSSNLWMKYSNDCCGTQVSLWVSEDTGCHTLPEQEKATLALLVSRGIEVMVRGCGGHFTRYVSQGALVARNEPPSIGLARSYVSYLDSKGDRRP